MNWDSEPSMMPPVLERVFILLMLLLMGTAFAPTHALGQDADTTAQDTEVVAPDTAHDTDAADTAQSHSDDTAHGDAQAHGEEAHGEGDHHTPRPPLWLVAPFILLLLMIATGPLFYAHHWHHHYPKYAVALGAFVSVYYIFVMDAPIAMVHALEEYLSFIALVASLFIAASGIYLKVNAKGRAISNVALLSFGALIANLIATTGAAMLLIRPYMNLNKGRLKPYHIVFFIFIIANVGGALTPIGDPPLFLGFLRGVPFFWTLTHVWYVWLPTMIILLGIFAIIDARNTAQGPEPVPGDPKIDITGYRSFIFVTVIVISVFIDPNVFDWVPELYVAGVHMPFGIREVIMFTMCYVAYRYAKQSALEKNQFTFEPIREVGWLFLGIFACMVPALNLISAFASDNADVLGVSTFYWGTGALSGFLDNAPTYLNFLAAAMGKFGADVGVAEQVRDFANPDLIHPESWIYLQAISVAAVFFGAMSYIGNAPNFMVKAIAESNDVDAPSFAGYLFKYAIPILLPVYFLVWVVFYSGWVITL